MAIPSPSKIPHPTCALSTAAPANSVVVGVGVPGEIVMVALLPVVVVGKPVPDADAVPTIVVVADEELDGMGKEPPASG